SRQPEPLPTDTESRIADFAELVATAIANAEARTELTASRARIVAAADETRRRIERDLLVGIQQRLVSLGLELRLAESTASAGLVGLRDRVEALGGTIDVESAENVGTLVVVELPLEVEPSARSSLPRG